MTGATAAPSSASNVKVTELPATVTSIVLVSCDKVPVITIVVEPAATPVTTPVVLSTVAIVGLVDINV